MRKPRTAILLPAGLSQPVSATKAKTAAKALDPAFESTLLAASQAGLKRVCIVTCPPDADLRKLVGTGAPWGLEVVYARQPHALGSADALLAVMQDQPGWINLSEPVLVTAVDSPMRPDMLIELVEGHARGGCDITMHLQRPRPAQAPPRRRVLTGENGRVRQIIDRPASGTSASAASPTEPTASFEASLIYILPPEIWERLPELRLKHKGKFELATVVNRLLESEFTACGFMTALPRQLEVPLPGEKAQHP